MSSIKGSSDSGNSSNTEELRRVRDEYRAKESELAKKHNKELQRIQEAHEADLLKITESHKYQLEDLRDKAHQALSVKDAKYRDEMENMRRLHRNQLQTTQNTSIEQQAKTRDTAERNIDLAKRSNEQRVNILKDDFSRQYGEQNEVYSQRMAELLASQKENMTNQQSNLTDRFNKEMGISTKGQNERYSDLERQYRTHRDDTGARFQFQEARHTDDRAGREKAHMSNFKRQEKAYLDEMGAMREGYSEGLGKTRERFQLQREEDNRKHSDNMLNLKGNVNERVENQVKGLEEDNAKLTQDRIRDRMKLEKGKKVELQHLKDDFQKRFMAMEESRIDGVRMTQEEKNKDLARARKEAQDHITFLNRSHHDQKETAEAQHREQFDSVVGDLKDQKKHTQDRADLRVVKIKSETDRELEQMRQRQDAALENIKGSNHDEKQTLRLAMSKERDEAIGRMRDFIRKNNLEHDQKVQTLVNNYEKNMMDINERYMRDKRLNDMQHKRTLDTQDRSHDQELEATKLVYDDRISRMKADYDKEMKSVNRRHQEQMSQILSNLRKS